MEPAENRRLSGTSKAKKDLPVILTHVRPDELEVLVNGTIHDQVAARLTIRAVMQYPVIARECQPYFE